VGDGNVSLRIDFFYSLLFTGPPAGSVTYSENVWTDGVTNLHGVIAESLPVLTLQVEQNLAEFVSGDVSLVCRNEDGWWDSTGFAAAYTDPTGRYPGCSGINVYQDSALVFQGDVDFKTVKFDRKVKTVTFTALGAKNRLSQWTAEIVRRSTPAFADMGYATDSGLQFGTPYISDSSKSWQTSGIDDVIGCCLIDSNGVVWQITGNATIGIGGVCNSLYLGSPVYAPPKWGTSVAGGYYPPASSYVILPMVFVSRYDWSSFYLAGWQGNPANITSGNTGNVPWVNDAMKSWTTDQWKGYALFDSSGVAWIIASNTGQKLWMVPGSGTPTISTTTGEYNIRKLMVYDLHSGGTITSNDTPSISDSGKTWSTNQWTGYVVIDSAGALWMVATNTATMLTLSGSGTPAVVGGVYYIKRPGPISVLESLGRSIADLGLLGQSATYAGDKLSLTAASGPIGATTIPASLYSYPVNLYAAKTQEVTVQFVATPATGLPVLTDHQVWLLEALESDIDAGDGVSLATPYLCDQKLADLVALLFAACGSVLVTSIVIPKTPVDAGGLTWTDYLVPYADFAGKSVEDALAELAGDSACALYTTFSGSTSSPTVTFHFQPRDAGTGSKTDLSGMTADGVTPKVMERSDGIAHEWYHPSIVVKGANKAQVQQGSLRPGAEQLSVSSDYVNDYNWLHLILDRLWLYFGSRRATATVKVKAEYLPVGSRDIFGRVSLDGTDEWWIVKVSYPLRTPVDAITLDLVSSVGIVYTPTDFATVDLTSVPEPPTITNVGKSGFNYTVSFKWPFVGTQPLLGFQRTYWYVGVARSAGNVAFIKVGQNLTVVPGSPVTFSDYIQMSLPNFYVDYQVVLADGRMSQPCPAALLP
jgi:hypothetical protein